MKLICPECRRENEAARIYCHDCGARLDRSSLAKEKQTEEDPKDTQRRLRGFFDGPSTPSSGAEKPSGGGKEAGSSSTTPATPSKPAETKSTKPAAD